MHATTRALTSYPWGQTPSTPSMCAPAWLRRPCWCGSTPPRRSCLSQLLGLQSQQSRVRTKRQCHNRSLPTTLTPASDVQHENKVHDWKGPCLAHLRLALALAMVVAAAALAIAALAIVAVAAALPPAVVLVMHPHWRRHWRRQWYVVVVLAAHNWLADEPACCPPMPGRGGTGNDKQEQQ